MSLSELVAARLSVLYLESLDVWIKARIGSIAPEILSILSEYDIVTSKAMIPDITEYILKLLLPMNEDIDGREITSLVLNNKLGVYQVGTIDTQFAVSIDDGKTCVGRIENGELIRSITYADKNKLDKIGLRF